MKLNQWPLALRAAAMAAASDAVAAVETGNKPCFTNHPVAIRGGFVLRQKLPQFAPKRKIANVRIIRLVEISKPPALNAD